MNGRLIAGGVLVLLVVVGGIFVLIGVLQDAGSNTDDPGDGTLPLTGVVHVVDDRTKHPRVPR